jgi:hypothetical protein
VVVLIVVISACEELPRLPTAPSNLTAGVAIYEHELFTGASALLTEDVLNLQSYSGGCDYSSSDKDYYQWNDCISSIKVLPPAR